MSMTDTSLGANTGPIARNVRRARGRPKSPETGNRVHIYIPDSLTRRLEEIQRDTHATSLTEVVKAAL
jgi:hypothetical protein